MSYLRLAGALLAIAVAARADVLHVPVQFPEIQDAIDAANQGDEVVIAAGEYGGVILIEDKTNLVLRGQGQVRLVGSVAGEPNIRINSSEQVVLDHLRVASSEADGIKVTGTDQFILRRCRVEASAGDGVHVENSHGVLLDKVVVTGSGGAGVFVMGSTGVSVTRCTLLGGDTGIEIRDGTGHFLERNTIKGTADFGLGLGVASVLGVDATIARDCVVMQAGGVGISARGTGLLIEGNRVLDPVSSGLLVFDGTCIVRDNLFLRAPLEGLDIVGGEHQVLDNRIVLAGDSGFIATGGGVQLVSGNRIAKAAGFGLNIGLGNDGSVLTDNRVTAPGDDGILVQSDDVQAASNTVQGAGNRGFMVIGSGGVFVGNKAKGSAIFDLFDASVSGNTYVDNDFGTISIP